MFLDNLVNSSFSSSTSFKPFQLVRAQLFSTLSLACPTGGQADDLSHDLLHQLRPEPDAYLPVMIPYDQNEPELLFASLECDALFSLTDVGDLPDSSHRFLQRKLQKPVPPLCEDDHVLHVDRS